MRFDKWVKCIPQSWSVEPEGGHREGTASEWGIEIVRPSMVLVNVNYGGEIRLKCAWKKIITEFVHKDA